MDVLSLLNSKNRCLERFLEISQDFLKSAEGGDFTLLERFERDRTSVLKGFDLYDRKLSEIIAQLPEDQRTPEFLADAEKALARKDELIHAIVSIDDRILRRMEEERARILQEIISAQKSQNTMKKFKSNWAENSGDRLDEKL